MKGEKMGMDSEQLMIFGELSEIIRGQNMCIELMKSFREKYPYLIPTNVARMVEENLKENVQILYRELNHLHKPPQEKRRHVCRGCHGVFFTALPGGLCDECRSKAEATQQPQYGRVAPTTRPTTEADTAAPPQSTAEADSAAPPPPAPDTAGEAAPPAPEQAQPAGENEEGELAPQEE
jgi:hypothetical protein